jgi:hypothetical protein
MGEKTVTVELAGGVGNQLFQYFAGKALSNKTGSLLSLDTSNLGLHGTLHKSDLSLLNTDSVFTYSKIRRVFNGSLVARINRKCQRQFNIYNQASLRITNRFQAQTLGYEPNLLHLQPPVRISGYFQTKKYFDIVADKGNSQLELLNPSKWFQKQVDRLERNEVVALHVRRGDYKNLKDSFGILSDRYYQEALSKMRSINDFEEVWVFSDELDVASQLLKDFPNLVFVNPPPESNAIESLMLMSKCDSQIISNSTFAWWAAVLNPARKIIAPSKWFKNHAYSEDLILPGWESVQSYWED